MRILIVAARYRPYGHFYELPLGLGYISSFLKSKGHDVKLLNMNEHPGNRAFVDEVEKANVLCTGGLSVHYGQVAWLLKYAKEVNPGIKIVLGGGLLSSEPTLITEDLNPDIGVIGEGESAFEDIFKHGFEKRVIHSQPIKDLDALPFPDYEGLGVRAYLDRQLCGDEHYLYPFDKPRCLPIISSRSCPHNCSFCFHPLGRVYRQRSLDNFFKEVEYLIETYQVNMLSVLDELISANPERLALFCERMRKYGLLWMTQMRADSVTKDTIAQLKDAGCHQISYGVESGSNAVLASMNKRTTIDVIEQALEWTYAAGIGIQGNFIFGDKAETAKTTQETIDWWMKHRHLMLNLSYVIPYPGCDLYKYATEVGLIEDRLDFIQKGCPTVPLSRDISQVSRIVEEHKAYGTLPASVLQSEVMGEDPFRGKLLRVVVTCPHCGKDIEYRNLFDASTNANMVNQFYRIGCRNCNQRFDIPKGALCQPV